MSYPIFSLRILTERFPGHTQSFTCLYEHIFNPIEDRYIDNNSNNALEGIAAKATGGLYGKLFALDSAVVQQ